MRKQDLLTSERLSSLFATNIQLPTGMATIRILNVLLERIRVRTDTWTLPLIAALAGNRACFRDRASSLGGNAHARTLARRRKFQTISALPARTGPRKGYVTLLLFLRALVLQ